MKKNVLYLVMLINLFYACGKSNETESIIIDPDTFTAKEINLSDFTNNISYIPLSNESPIAWIYSIQTMDNKYFISVSPQQIKVYDRQGDFLYNIGNVGRGPGEYKYSFRYALDNKKKHIYILDTKEILVFSVNGDYERNINISDYGGNFDAIGYNDGHLYLFEIIQYGQAKYNWLIIDNQGKKIGTRLNYIPQFKSQFAMLINVMFKFNNHFCYWNSLNDTIFDVYLSDHQSRYQFASNQYRLTPENFDDMKNYSRKIFIPFNILESKKYLFLNYYMEGKTGLGLFDKSREQMLSLMQKSDQENKMGFINDFDGGINFTPKDFLLIDDHEYLVGWTNANTIIDHVKSKAFQSFTPKHPEKKKEIEKLGNSLNESDNPVLMLVKLKE